MATTALVTGVLTTTAATVHTGGITMPDNAKAIFGAGSDLQIYHDGSNSIIHDAGTGVLKLRATDFRLANADNTKDYLAANDGAAVNISYNGFVKLATTATGIDVTGTVTADGLTIDTDAYRRLLLTYPDAFTSKLQVGYSSFYVQGSSTTDVLTIANNTSGQTEFINQSKKSMLIDNSGDISFYEGTGTTPKFFWDASAERLGIGTSSPGRTLDVIGIIRSDGTSGAFALGGNSSTPSEGVAIHRPAADTMAFVTASTERMRIDASGNVNITGGNLSVVGQVTATGGAVSAPTYSFISDTDTGISRPTTNAVNIVTAGTERMRIDSSGNVGIGRTPSVVESTYDSLQLGAGGTWLSGSTNLAAGNFGQNYYIDASGDNLYLGNDEAERIVLNNGYIAFETAPTNASGAGAALTWSESMRIDSSGNVLVGKTAQTVDTVGGEILSTGIGQFTVDGNFAGRFTRQTSDGDIVVFRKGTGTVGSIGAKAGDLVVGTGDTGLRFSDASSIIEPQNITTNSGTDGTVDLGWSSGRFKDLYLSGGVYLGGTVAANKLDDYEEGTFDVTIDTGTSGTITINPLYDKMSYTKIGNVVTINGEIRVSSVSSPVGSETLIDGLPFLSINLGDFAGRAGGGFYHYDASSGNQSVQPMRVTEVETRIRLSIDASTIATNDEFGFSFSYMTAS
jgi:hypothetical protein